MFETKIKDPDANLDYKFDWSAELTPLNDTISDSSIVAPAGITIGSSTKTARTVTVWISGGSAGKKYLITNRITTAAVRIYDKSFYLKIETL